MGKDFVLLAFLFALMPLGCGHSTTLSDTAMTETASVPSQQTSAECVHRKLLPVRRVARAARMTANRGNVWDMRRAECARAVTQKGISHCLANHVTWTRHNQDAHEPAVGGGPHFCRSI